MRKQLSPISKNAAILLRQPTVNRSVVLSPTIRNVAQVRFGDIFEPDHAMTSDRPDLPPRNIIEKKANNESSTVRRGSILAEIPLASRTAALALDAPEMIPGADQCRTDRG